MSAPQQEQLQPPTLFVYYDLETTGLSAKTAETLELAAEVDPAFKIDARTFASLVRPACAVIPADASNVNGIYMEDVKDKPAFETVAARFLHFLAQCMIETETVRVMLIAHNNTKFDAPIFKRQCQEAELVIPDWIVFGDSLTVFQICFPKPRRRFALQALATLWIPKEAQIKQEHRAASDVAMLMLVVRHCPDRELFFRTLLLSAVV